MMFFALGPLMLVVQLRPHGKPPSLVCKLMEALQHEFRTGPSSMDPYTLAAAFCDRRYSRELLYIYRGLKSIRSMHLVTRHRPRLERLRVPIDTVGGAIRNRGLSARGFFH